MGIVVWFTGLSGSGKSTIANALKKRLEEKGKTVETLDGDVVREKLHRHLGFSREDIGENNRLIAELAKKSSADVVLVPVIAPYREDREMARKIIGKCFFELYVNAPLHECIRRDAKGLYKKAQAGEIDLIGFIGPNTYEAPETPDIEVTTLGTSVAENVEEIMNLLFLPFDARDELKLAIKAALSAGKAIMEVYASNFSTEKKSDNEPVTVADTRSDAIIRSVLSRFGYPILSEESADDKTRLQHSRVWIVDPLDGTSSFVERKDDFSVLIGLVENGVPVIGVIYAPATRSLYIAEKGKGAFAIGASRLHVNKTELTKCIPIMSFHHLSEHDKAFVHSLGITEFARMGSCGMKIVEICKGNADFYISSTNRIKQWDTCAPWVLLNEAGGTLTDVRGNALRYNTENVNHTNGILASNGYVHDELVKRYKKFQS